MSFWKQTEVTDILNNLARVSPYGELLIADSYRLAGAAFSGPTVDPGLWATAVTGTGTVTQLSAQQILATGATANSTALSQSTSIARYIASSENRFISRVQMGDSGTVNNARRWGPFNGTDGAYFKLSGTTLSIATMIGGVETAVASASWNGTQTVPTLTNLNLFEILYAMATVTFLINGNVAHTLSAAVSPWAATPHFPAYADNVNSGGGTANVSMSLRVFVITRLGRYETQPMFSRITTAGTVVMKYGPGVLHRITFGNSGGTTLTLYDNTAGSGTVISAMSTPAQAQPLTLHYGVPFNTGLTVVSTGTWDATVIYE